METITEPLLTLAQLTEEKIQAVMARDPQRLLSLLQAEIDPMRQLDRFVDDMERLSFAERTKVRQLLTRWQNRSQYLGEILMQHLGYIDFVRSVIHAVPGTGTTGLDLGL